MRSPCISISNSHTIRQPSASINAVGSSTIRTCGSCTSALTINARFPEIAQETIAKAHGDEGKLARAEQEAIGFDHAYLGAMMLENWQLPETTCDAIRYHHQPHAAKVTPLEAGIINAAETLANFSGTGSFSETIAETDEISTYIRDLIELPTNFDHDELLEEVDQQFIETIYLLVA